MNNKRKTRSKTKKTNLNKDKVLYRNTILGLLLLNTFFIIFSIFSNTGFLGNIIKNVFQKLFGGTYIIFLIIMEIIYTVVILGKLNKKNKNRSIMGLLVFFNYMGIVDLSNNTSNNLSIKFSIAQSTAPKGSGYLGAILGYFYNIMIGTIGLYVFTFIIALFLILSFLDITFIDFLKILKINIIKLYNTIHERYLSYKERKAQNNNLNELKNEENVVIVDNVNDVEQSNDVIYDEEIIVSDHNNGLSNENDVEIEELEKDNLLDSFNLFPDDNEFNKERKDKENKINTETIDIKMDTSEGKKIEYKIPSLNLLKGSKNKETESESTLKDRARKIETTLKSFGVGAKVVRINKGPTVTCFELQPDMGVKVNKIVNLADDLSLALASSDIRIEAPIPGKSAIGIEVANTLKENVSLKEILSSKEYQNSTSKMPMALGKTISGDIIVSSIDKMPHMLIAGATGSGKSVCINTLIMSILYKSSPEDVKMILIDPKVVELKIYNNIPHLAIPVVTDSKKASAALNWAVREMERRYSLFSDNQVRDIKGYNEKQKIDELEKLPYLVIIIDELSDLMMVSANEVESYICRLAQMARACGIHLIVATQRPSVDVITGTIKANIPSRISFQVSSQIDSRTILDASGAETLLGRGDMLFNPSGVSKPIRIQGCFVSDSEVEAVVNNIKEQSNDVIYDEEIIRNIESEVSNLDNSEDDDVDDLFYDAVKIVLEENSASISLLQRKMKIGYARAGRIIDEMESRMIVGKQEGSKPRKILVGYDYLEMKKGDTNEYSK